MKIIHFVLELIFGNKMTRLQSRSVDALRSFTETVNNLREVNKEISIEIESKESKARKLQDEASALSADWASNERIANKINEILGR